MPQTDFDIAICGAGPVGSALALLLARHAPSPHRIALIARPSPPSKASKALDPRALALNYGSIQLLKSVAAWPGAAASISTVHVSQKGRLGRTLISATELGVDRLGGVVGYDTLLKTLGSALQASGVCLLSTALPQGDASLQADPLLTSEGLITCRAKVLSDGAKPVGIQRDYNQHALVATLRSSRPRTGWAYERFTSDGPFALLPHPSASDLYALVWCNPPEKTATLEALNNADFEAKLLQTFGSRLGRLKLAGDRFVFPLSMYAGPSLPARHTVAIGNAAQTLHPVAGQGLNLGLRDAAQLSQALRPWLAMPQSDVGSILELYANKRRLDRCLTASVTDVLPRIFATSNPLVQHTCGLGLLAMDVLEIARLPLARHLLQGTRT
ncbi:FAD-dependent monooxygenase [Paenalcaligenes niemegkensis]|uniref:FAD-dependent monooxygenase n=1 Tax=Paenalcaligenes niemegkensis TaxID=2895469 RepID=UPI001EE96613|nr:FAD-dependent monooxygenase [Paenalcaligenes niemegkensis]MCQ9617108.1 FAD-dependent monooxygenase [Paenalcaligenes niemegkensis]